MNSFLHSAIAAYRCFSTYKSSRWVANGNKWFRCKTKKVESASSSPKRTRIKWTDEQKLVFDAVSSGHSVFVTGSAGTGKTFLIDHVVKILKKIHPRGTVYVTASTGTAACSLNGQTLHSFAGTGITRYMDRQLLLERVRLDRKACYRWSGVKALVIDEISMIDSDFFDGLEYVARKIRSEGNNPSEERTWGGIQLVVSGDFFQLPPVIQKLKKGAKVFAFEADCWNLSFDLQIELTKIFRQSDPQLIKLLQGIRKGEIGPEELQILEQCSSPSEPEDPSVVQLFPLTEDVASMNKRRMESLQSKIVVYNAIDSDDDPWKKKLLDKLIAPQQLELCVGARVMLIKNVDVWRKLVNGATGTITRFIFYLNYKVKKDKDIQKVCEYGNLLPVVKFDSGPEMVIGLETWEVTDGDKVVAKRKHIPLMLAWAMSIHKCQGRTLDSLHTNLKRSFGPAMVYVALSRVRSLSGLHLSGFDPSKIMAHPKVLQFYETFSCKETRAK